MKKSLLVFALLLSLLLSACGGMASSDSPAQENWYNGGDSGASFFPAEAEEGSFGAVADASPSTGESQRYSLSSALQGADVKLILRAELDVETLDFDTASAGLDALVASMGGYYENKELYQGGYYSDGTHRSASYVVRVPSGQYDAFLSAMSEADSCHVVRTREYVDNVGQEYFDAESRLKTQRIKQERLQALLARADNMGDIIAIENALSDVEYQIDYYTTTLNRYDGLIDFATITLNLSQVGRLTEQAREGLGARMARGFREGAASFADGLEDFAVWISYHFIGVVLFLIAVALVLRFGLQLRKKRRISLAPPPSEDPQEKK